MLNPYFQQGARSEQNLVQDLINEQLKMYGVECYYLPRQYATTDNVIKEVISSDFNYSYPIEAYVENYEGYGDNVVIVGCLFHLWQCIYRNRKQRKTIRNNGYYL